MFQGEVFTNHCFIMCFLTYPQKLNLDGRLHTSSVAVVDGCFLLSLDLFFEDKEG